MTKKHLQSLYDKAHELGDLLNLTDLGNPVINDNQKLFGSGLNKPSQLLDSSSRQVVKVLNANDSKKGKLPIGELHPQFLKSLALVSEVSKLKGYKPLNWIKSDFKGGYLGYHCSAALRHILAIMDGEDLNQEQYPDGRDVELVALHAEHAAYDLLMLATLFRLGRHDLDDRIK